MNDYPLEQVNILTAWAVI